MSKTNKNNFFGNGFLNGNTAVQMKKYGKKDRTTRRYTGEDFQENLLIQKHTGRPTGQLQDSKNISGLCCRLHPTAGTAVIKEGVFTTAHTLCF